MKKILSLILAICMGITAMSFSVSAQEVKTDTELSEAMEVLRMFDIISDYYDYNTNYKKEVSRADFADAVAKLISNSAYEPTEVYYYDVPTNHYAYKSIAMLTSLGVINGVGDNLFKPDDFIEDSQAYKILLSVMGYGPVAEVNGGYPAGYNEIARRLRIFQNSDNTEILTYRDMFMILYNALDVNVMEAVSFQNGQAEHKISDNETLLTLYRDLYKEEGILNGAKMMVLGNTETGDEKEVIIGSTVYNSDVDLSGFLGEEIEYYVKKKSENEKGTIFWAKQTGKSKVTNIKTEDVTNFDSSTYTLTYYGQNGKKTSISFEKGASILYNGVEIGKEIKEALTAANGEIKIVENSGVGTAVIIKAYKNYVVSNVNLSNGTVYDKRGSLYSVVIDENKADYVSLKNASGTDMTLNQIAAGAVMSLYMSRDGKYAEAVVHTEKVSGKLEAVSKKDKGTELKIDDKTYLLKQTNNITIPEIGSSVEVYLDFEGNPAYIEKSQGVNFAAYIKDAAIIEGVFDAQCGIKLFTEDGEHKELFCAEKTMVDGKEEKDAKNIYAALCEGGSVKHQLVLVKINSDNEITMIDTQYVNEPYESVKSSLSLNSPKSGTWVRGSGSVNRYTVVNGNTKFFEMPSVIDSDTPDKAFGVSKSLANETTYKVETYKTTDRVGYEEYVIVYDKISTGFSYTIKPVVVEGIGQAIDPDGGLTECIFGYQGKDYVTLLSDGDVSFEDMGIKKGMVVRVANDTAGLITDAEIIFDIAEKEKYMTKESEFSYASSGSRSIGYLYDVVDNVVSISWSDITKVDHRVAPYTAPVIVYDTSIDKNNIYVGSLSDGITAHDAGENCSTILAFENSSHAQLFVLFK